MSETLHLAGRHFLETLIEGCRRGALDKDGVDTAATLLSWLGTPAVLPDLARRPRTEEFRDWIRYSRVKQPVYHATAASFEVFDTSLSDLGAHFGTADQALNISRIRLSGEPGKLPRILAAWLAVENPLRLKDVGSFHADGIAVQLEKKGLLPRGEGKRIEREIEKNFRLRREYDPMLLDIIKKAGYDGLVYQNTCEGEGPGLCYTAFRPDQIRDATGMGFALTGRWISEAWHGQPEDSRETGFTRFAEGFEAYWKDETKEPQLVRLSFEKFGAWLQGSYTSLADEEAGLPFTVRTARTDVLERLGQGQSSKPVTAGARP